MAHAAGNRQKLNAQAAVRFYATSEAKESPSAKSKRDIPKVMDMTSHAVAFSRRVGVRALL